MTTPKPRPPRTGGPPRLYIAVGLPGSTKTTWAVERRDADRAAGIRSVIVERDGLRAMLLGPDSHGVDEPSVSAFAYPGIHRLLTSGVTVYCSDTNLIADHRKRLIDTGERAGAVVVIVDHFLEVPVDECIARDARRANPVGARVIRGMWARYCADTTAATA